MAIRTVSTWSYNSNQVPDYCIGLNTFTSDLLEYAVVVAVLNTRYYNYELPVNGENKHPAQVYIVGTRVDPAPEDPTVLSTWDFTQGNETLGSPIVSTTSYSVHGDYAFYYGPTNGYIGIWSTPDYVYDNYSDFTTAMDNGEIVDLKPKLDLHVYVNGTKDPSIQCRWTMEDNEVISPLTADSRFCIATPPLLSYDVELLEDPPIYNPAVGNWYVQDVGKFSWNSQYDSSYLSWVDTIATSLNPVNRVQFWGIDGYPSSINLLHRFTDGDAIGELHRIIIPRELDELSDITVETVSHSKYRETFNTRVFVHYGSYPPDDIDTDDDDFPGGRNSSDTGPGRYDPNNPFDPSFFTDNAGIGFDGENVLTKSYSLNSTILENVGQKLWTQSYFDVLKIQNNPIQNIVSCKHYPFSVSGTSEDIVVGDVSFGINGYRCSSVKHITIGSYTYSGFNPSRPSYLDLSPFTTIKIFLPYCGFVQLDASAIFGSPLNVEYVVDLITGDCLAILTLETAKVPYMSVKGKIGIDVPLTATDRVQTELATASSVLSAAGSLPGQVINGGITQGAASALAIVGSDYNSQRTTSPSPVCSSYELHGVYLIIERPLDSNDGAESPGYKHLHGYPCHKYMTLRELKEKGGGFVKVDLRTDIQVAMTEEENEMLEDLLTDGIYL